MFLVMTMSSIGLPGLNGFIGEFMILMGAFPVELALDGHRRDGHRPRRRLHALALPAGHVREDRPPGQRVPQGPDGPGVRDLPAAPRPGLLDRPLPPAVPGRHRQAGRKDHPHRQPRALRGAAMTVPAGYGLRPAGARARSSLGAAVAALFVHLFAGRRGRRRGRIRAPWPGTGRGRPSRPGPDAGFGRGALRRALRRPTPSPYYVKAVILLAGALAARPGLPLLRRRGRRAGRSLHADAPGHGRHDGRRSRPPTSSRPTSASSSSPSPPTSWPGSSRRTGARPRPGSSTSSWAR
ncbi:MAG: hypothetical protein MZV64_18125 [Ignavibacteriales bacterium]|nr:hypothetical protein [Ignavibacteriales bacterium]